MDSGMWEVSIFRRVPTGDSTRFHQRTQVILTWPKQAKRHKQVLKRKCTEGYWQGRKGSKRRQRGKNIKIYYRCVVTCHRKTPTVKKMKNDWTQTMDTNDNRGHGASRSSTSNSGGALCDVLQFVTTLYYPIVHTLLFVLLRGDYLEIQFD